MYWSGNTQERRRVFKIEWMQGASCIGGGRARKPAGAREATPWLEGQSTVESAGEGWEHSGLTQG